MRFHNHWTFHPGEHDVANGLIGFSSENYKYGIPTILQSDTIKHWKFTSETMINIVPPFYVHNSLEKK